MTALAPATARATNWAVLLGLVTVGLLAILALQTRRASLDVGMIELLNREPPKLSPFLAERMLV